MHQSRHASEPLRLGPFDLDLRARELRKNGQVVRLQDKPFELLVALTERPGEVITRQELRSRLWPSDTFVVFDDSLNVAVRKLRDALGDSTDSPQFIQTVPRHGYRYIGPIDRGSSAAPADGVEAVASNAPVRHRRRLVVRAVVALGLGAIGTAAWWTFTRSPIATSPPVIRFEINPPPSTHFPTHWSHVAVSPDGRQVAFCAVSRPSLVLQVWLQSLASRDARPLAGTENATDLAWSPDGQAIAFRSTSGALKRYDLDDGATTDLAEATPYAGGLSWSESAGILYAPGQGLGLSRVTPNGGGIERVTMLDSTRDELMHAWPQFLPDGQTFIYLAISRRPEWTALYLTRVGESTRRLVRAGRYKARYVHPGMLVFADADARGVHLLAQPFDPNRGTLAAEPVEIASNVLAQALNGAAAFSAAADVLAYEPTPHSPRRELVWVNRAGQRLAVVVPADHFASFTLSPDGRWVALQAPSPDPGPAAPDLWLLDLTSGVRSRATRSPGNDEGGVWAGDSRRFVYACHPDIHKPAAMCLKNVDDPETEASPLGSGIGSRHPFDWSADGRFILFGLVQRGETQDIWALPLDDRVPAYSWLATQADEGEARFSPDGRWVAYQSNETGQWEVFVRAFDPPGSRWQVSQNGGILPQWSRDGKELYFVSGDHHLTAVAVRHGPRFEADPPRPLFELRRLKANPSILTTYAPSQDSQRFLLGAVVEEGGDSPLGVVLNWPRLLQEHPRVR